jgi:undecaprenol kinase/diacylglycerol kinase (ATP)
MRVDVAPPHPGDSQVTPVAAPQTWRGNFWQGFVHAFAGVGYAIRTQRNMRVHLACAALAIILGVFFHISLLDFALLAIVIGAVLVMEMLNTVTEAIVDMVTQSYHPLAKVAKDVAAGAVLVSAIFAVIVGVLVFAPHLLALLAHH